MRWRSTRRRRCRCSGWPRARDGHFLANQCRAWSEALDQLRGTRCPRTPTSRRGARQIARAMRADLFDIDCDFYLAGPGRVRGHAGRRAARRGRAGAADLRAGGLNARSVPPAPGRRCRRRRLRGGEVFALRVLGAEHGAGVRRGRDHRRRARGPGPRRLLRAGLRGRANGPFASCAVSGEGWCLHALNPAFARPAAGRPDGRARRHHPEGAARAPARFQTLRLRASPMPYYVYRVGPVCAAAQAGRVRRLQAGLGACQGACAPRPTSRRRPARSRSCSPAAKQLAEDLLCQVREAGPSGDE